MYQYSDGEDRVDYKEEEYTGIEFTPTDELTEEQKKKALSGIKEGKFGIQVDSCDKVRALELLEKTFRIFNDKIDVNVKEKEEKKNAISDILKIKCKVQMMCNVKIKSKI